MTPTDIKVNARKRWMGLLAKAPATQLHTLFERLKSKPQHSWLRAPETGGAMVRGRMGGTGALFNVGEMTVTRCALRLQTGEVGHAYVQGRDKDHAERAAIIDAMMQTPHAGEVEATVLHPLAHGAAENFNTRAAKAAATKVEFFTMVRGED
ncbi:phosphonate C-P lyase system protein PhnG [Cochlodiniinecator piscidefendens]|uniref:phosphonate C-P lyase system protein PhnG n=1 Tax=Cochlodiniinecator piscidefendens TaxID=2715756 RepID=UPI001408D33C|nr:phosphonate C-P lyase system protein PhnG [Cochlodiniinecator piscidefendens]